MNQSLRVDPSSYSESIQPITMTIFSDPSIPELILLNAGEDVLLDQEDLVLLDAGNPAPLDAAELVLLDAGEPVPLDAEEHSVSVGYKKRSCISGMDNDLREKN